MGITYIGRRGRTVGFVYEAESMKNAGGEWIEKKAMANIFITPALEVYFRKLGHNPFKEE